jgi:hypothetical protein
MTCQKKEIALIRHMEPKAWIWGAYGSSSKYGYGEGREGDTHYTLLAGVLET